MSLKFSFYFLYKIVSWLFIFYFLIQTYYCESNKNRRYSFN